MEPIPTKTYYLDEGNQVTIACPSCNRSKRIDASKYKNIGQGIHVRCKCGRIFLAKVNFRKHYRKKVALAGKYRNMRTRDEGAITIQNISLSGIGFSTFPLHEIHIDDTLSLDFELDNRAKSRIALEVKVKFVRGEDIGCQVDDWQDYEKDMNSYLRT